MLEWLVMITHVATTCPCMIVGQLEFGSYLIMYPLIVVYLVNAILSLESLAFSQLDVSYVVCF